MADEVENQEGAVSPAEPAESDVSPEAPEEAGDEADSVSVKDTAPVEEVPETITPPVSGTDEGATETAGSASSASPTTSIAPPSPTVTVEAEQKEQTPPPSTFDRFKENAKNARQFLTMALFARQVKRRKNLEKVMSMFATKQRITNDMIEKFLHVSNNTATRYLSILLKEGRIRPDGKKGREAGYVKSL